MVYVLSYPALQEKYREIINNSALTGLSLLNWDIPNTGEEITEKEFSTRLSKNTKGLSKKIVRSVE